MTFRSLQYESVFYVSKILPVVDVIILSMNELKFLSSFEHLSQDVSMTKLWRLTLDSIRQSWKALELKWIRFVTLYNQHLQKEPGKEHSLHYKQQLVNIVQKDRAIQGKNSIFWEVISSVRSQDGSVGIVTRYGLEGPGIESGWGEIFRTYPDRLWGPTSLLYNGYRVFPGGKGGRGMMLTTHPLLLPRLRKSWGIPPLTL